MPKGSYTVGDDNPQPPVKDTSYKSFICVLLVFLFICLIILLASIGWGSSNKSPDLEHGGHNSPQTGKKDTEVFSENKARMNKTHEKVKDYDDSDPARTDEDGKEEARDDRGEQKEIETDYDLDGTTVRPAEDTTRVIGPEHTTRSNAVAENRSSTTKPDQTTKITVEIAENRSSTTEQKHTNLDNATSAENGNSTSDQEQVDSDELVEGGDSTTEQEQTTLDTVDRAKNGDSTLTTPSTTNPDDKPTDNRNGTTEQKEASLDNAALAENSNSSTDQEQASLNSSELDSTTEHEQTTERVENGDDTTEQEQTTLDTADRAKNGNSTTEQGLTTPSTTNPDDKPPENRNSTTEQKETSFDNAVLAENSNSSTEQKQASLNSSELYSTTEQEQTTSASMKADAEVTENRRITTEQMQTTLTTTQATADLAVGKELLQQLIFSTIESTDDVSSTTPAEDGQEESISEAVQTTNATTEPVKRSPVINETQKSSTIGSTSTTTTTIPLTTETTSTTEASINESDSDFTFSKTSTSSWLTNTSKPVCKSNVCKATAAQILGMMDHSAEPCENFYDFACGKAHKKKDELFSDEMLQDELHMINESSAKYLQDFKQFYQSCVNYENSFDYHRRLEGVEVLLAELGQFQWNNTGSVDLTDLFVSLILQQSMPLFDIGVDIDQHSGNFILQLTAPNRGFLRPGLDQWSGLELFNNQCFQEQTSQIHNFNINLDDVYAKYVKCEKNYTTYLDSLSNVIRDLKVFQSLDPASLHAEVKEIRFTIEFDVFDNLAKLPSEADILDNLIGKSYEVRKIKELRYHYPVLDWERLFKRLTGREADSDTTIQLYFPQYFKALFKLCQNIDKKKLNNALLSMYAYDLFINTVIPKEASTRSHFCADLSKKLLPDVFAHIVDETFPSEERNRQNVRVKDLFEKLKKDFCRCLTEAEWIDDETKISIVKKCNNLKLAPFTASDPAGLLTSFETVKLTNDYQTDLIHLIASLKHRIYSLAGTPLTSGKIFSYFLDPSSSKPLTFYGSPIIAVPLGLANLAPEGIPKYLELAKIGFSLARQLARHFDPTGMKYGITLASTSLFSYREFNHTMLTLMDDSSPFLFHNKNLTFSLNGWLSINDRVVDNAAFRLISDSVGFSADRDMLPWFGLDYAREKIFFIATAQEFCTDTTVLDFMLQVFEDRHVPPVLRVKNIMGSSEKFFENFQCAEGVDMDLSMKIQFPFLETVSEDYEEGPTSK